MKIRKTASIILLIFALFVILCIFIVSKIYDIYWPYLFLFVFMLVLQVRHLISFSRSNKQNENYEIVMVFDVLSLLFGIVCLIFFTWLICNMSKFGI